MIVSARRVVRRPYFFELLVVANLVIVLLVSGRSAMAAAPIGIASSIPVLLACLLAGMGWRIGAAAIRGEKGPLLRVFTSRGWIVDTARCLLAQALLTMVYSWIKLTIPIIHPRLMDQQLWEIDRAIFFGYSPNILFLALFSNPLFLRLIDLTYGLVFYLSSLFIFAFALSKPSRRYRMAFMTSNVLTWIIGAWLYLLVPSLGPVYRFPSVWFEYTRYLPGTQELQLQLLRNYTNVLRWHGGNLAPVGLFFGIAAFPSLHVAWLTLISFWMRHQARHSGFVFGMLTAAIFVGSIITGWHYLIDSIAGVALGAGSYWVGSVVWRYQRWRTLCSVVSRGERSG